jgi:predicted dienelactone hydrolase
MNFMSLVSVCAAVGLLSHAAYAGSVGFSKLSVPDGANPPLEVGVWYPTRASPQPTRIGLYTQTVAQDAPVAGNNLPLVVMSHGHGGEFAGHDDTAFALATDGIVAASLTHTGDNYRDDSQVLDVAARTRQLHALIDYMVADWPAHAVDPARIGAFGFSAGGFTVLAEAGGIPDLRLIASHCRAHPAFYDCQLPEWHGHPGGPVHGGPTQAFVHDTRIKAVVAAAPALGFTFVGDGLRNVTMPVQLWRAGDDAILPSPFYVEPVAAALPRAPEVRVVTHAGHFDFLAPCPQALAHMAPAICTSEPGFDRVAFHETFDRDVVAFFERTLVKQE